MTAPDIQILTDNAQISLHDVEGLRSTPHLMVTLNNGPRFITLATGKDSRSYSVDSKGRLVLIPTPKSK